MAAARTPSTNVGTDIPTQRAVDDSSNPASGPVDGVTGHDDGGGGRSSPFARAGGLLVCAPATLPVCLGGSRDQDSFSTDAIMGPSITVGGTNWISFAGALSRLVGPGVETPGRAAQASRPLTHAVRVARSCDALLSF